MIVSWNWLGEYVRLDVPVERLAERLALAGLNHEGTEEVGGDLAIDLEVTSNRPDLLSHLGVAREVAVLFGKTLREPDPNPSARGEPVESLTRVDIEAPDLCPRFTARVVTGAKIGVSPWWMAKRLETLGIARISDVVDVTNYVMFECGQPLHAYDLDKLEGRRLVVRRAREGETLRAINGKTYELSPEMLVIADARRPVGLAGVMGGLETEIGTETRNILIESAQFDPMTVRRTARALGLFSPSSYRFERALDPEQTEWASRRCAELILRTAGGRLHPGVIDQGRQRSAPPEITLRMEQIGRVLGIEVERPRAEGILRALGLEEVAPLTFRPPSWRSDLEREIDLIEEVARIHGYEHIPEDRDVPLARSSKGDRERVEGSIRSTLTGLGLDEAYTFSLVPEELAGTLGPAPEAPPIRVEHSSRRRENLLRVGLVPSLLAARAYNEAHGNADADLFEIAQVYLPRADRPLPDEPARLGLVAGGDYFALKGIVEGLLGALHAEGELEARPCDSPLGAEGRSAELRLGGERFGVLAEIDRQRLGTFGLRGGCSAAELDLGTLIRRANLVPQYAALPPFPPVARDLSLVVPRDLPWSELSAAARDSAGTTLESIAYLDTFVGAGIPEGMHSLHFGLRFRHPERTLTGEEVDRTVRAVVEACAARFGATLRA